MALAAALTVGAGGADTSPEIIPEAPSVKPDPVWECVATESAVYTGAIVYYDITTEDRHVLECVVQGEAGGESLEGKMWVATCLLNAMRREGGASAEFVRTKYQYSGWSEDISDDTIRAVSRVFDDGKVMHDRALWFYAPKYCNGSWHETQEFVVEIGGHRFFCPRETR